MKNIKKTALLCLISLFITTILAFLYHYTNNEYYFYCYLVGCFFTGFFTGRLIMKRIG
jgi:hypothetical protein